MASTVSGVYAEAFYRTATVLLQILMQTVSEILAMIFLLCVPSKREVD